MASIPRLFTTEALCPGHTIVGTETQRHYLKSVMRRASGHPAIMFNGRDGEWRAHITLTERSVQFLVDTQLRAQAREPDIWLAFSPLKRDLTELVVQKATELGVAALLPVMTERTQPGRVNSDRLRLIAIEAAEQCERLSVPAIHPPRSLAELLASWPTGRDLYVAAERRIAPVAGKTGVASALLIGPEGGFAAAELDALCLHPFVHPVSLGPRILRAETAAIAGLALLVLPA